ncbi:interferon-induced protein 44-like [Danio aesculapii]|uniref:interferon-induced protein 44-like n=1 Tax=Danio aesculapii TaxID=1142201 RepID=UPI0024BFE3FD|nr:interferon-induced protein 44-like [Danio aesculapii]
MDDIKQKAALKEKLENFSPSDPNVKDIKILVAGQVGAGKSSFINSINSAFQGRISTRALVNSAEGGSHSFTQKLEGFTIRSGKKPLPFVFFDIMGLEPAALAGPQTEDIISAVFGHVQDGYKVKKTNKKPYISCFNTERPLTAQDQEYTTYPNLSDQSFCLVYVIDAITFHFIDDQLIDKLKIIRKRISNKGKLTSCS